MEKLYKFCCPAIFIVILLVIIGCAVFCLVKKIQNLCKQSKEKSEEKIIEKSCKFTVAFYVSFIVTAMVFIVCIVWYFIGDMHLYNPSQTLYSFVPVLLCILYLIFAFFSVWVLLKFAKYFSKLDILENLMKSGNINDKELIKKYCDTPVDL